MIKSKKILLYQLIKDREDTTLFIMILFFLCAKIRISKSILVLPIFPQDQARW